MTDQPTEKSLFGLIPAAGKGVRARPYTNEIHKGMLDINGKPNIERIIELMRDQLKITDIVIVTGHLGESIRNYFEDGNRCGVNITYVENMDLDKGWAWSVQLAAPYIEDFFCVMLCDEYYLNTNHHLLLETDFRDHLATCAAIQVDDIALIRKNYAVEKSSSADDSTVNRLIEKPEAVPNNWLGTGTFVCSPAIFALLQNAFQEAESLNFVSFLNDQIGQRQSVSLFELRGTYVNINDRDSLQLARDHASNYRSD